MIFAPQSPNRARLFITGIVDRWKISGALFNCLPGFLFALLLLSPISAISQSTAAALSGTVADSTGAVIPDAKIVLRNTDTGTEQTTATGGTGTYSVTNILPGIYSIKVTKSGFNAAQRDRFTLLVNQTLSLNFTLTIGNTQQTVTITGDVSTVQSTTAELGTVITTRSVSDLPLNGRNFTQLLTLTPGVSPVSVGQNHSGGGFAGNAIGTFTFPSVNGQRNRSNMFLLDGVNDLGFLGNYNYSPIVDGIQEFKVQSHNDLAEFGQVTGGIINVATKGGSNNFHGSLWEFVRNEQLDARNYFAAKRNPLRQNQFGGTVGGPVRIPHVYNGKEKTFFFFGYEGFRQRLLNQSPVISPTTAELGGDFSSLLSAPNLVSKTPVQLYNPYSTRPDPVQSGKFIRDPFPGNIIPQSLLNPAAVLYASTLFPSPSGSVIAGGNVIDNTRTQVDENNYTGRIDHNFGEHDILFGRVSYLHEPSSASAGFPGALTSTDITSWNFALHESHVFSSTAILETHFGRNLGNDVIVKGFPNAPANFGESLVAAGMSSNFLSNFQALPGTLTPLISIAGYASTSGSNIQGTQIADTYQYGADFTKILGRHTFKIGGEYSTVSFNGPIAVTVEGTSAFQTANLEATTGATTGDSLASFLLGVPASASRRDVTEIEHGGSIDGVYLQDQIKVNPKLSLNVGVRYDVTIWPGYGSLSNGQGYVGDMDLSNGTYIVTAIPPACSTTVGAPCIPGGSLPANVVVSPNGTNSIHNTDYGNIQGRFGFAYAVAPTTSLRGGYSRFYDSWNGIAQFGQNVGGNWPSVGLLTQSALNNNIPTASFNDPLGLGANPIVQPPANPFNNNGSYYDPNLKTPYTDQWNLGIDQDLGHSTTFSISYAGSHSGRLDVGGRKNTARYPGPGNAATVAARRPYPYIAAISYDESNGNSNYHSLQTKLSRSTSNGLTYLVSYTRSKSIDIGCSGDFGAEGCEIQDAYNPRADRSVSGFDVTNIFSASVVYELPLGRGKLFSPSNPIVSAIVGGWQTNAIGTFVSGAPYDVTVSGDIANTGNTFVRANLVGNPNPQKRTAAQWINTSAFATPLPYTFGNLGRNSLRSDSSKDLDLSLFRRFPLTHETGFEFRAEAFNLTNTAVFSAPAHVINSTNFGVVTSTANNPRQIQLALKLQF